MNKNFTKKDLRTGDIVVLRNGTPGVVILETNIILYQQGGHDDLDAFSEDLRDEWDDDRRFDIVEVYSGSEGPINFLDYQDEEPVYVREDEIDLAEPENTSGKEPDAAPAADSDTDRRKADLLTIIAQGFYGNRTVTEILPEEMDRFILGILDSSWDVTEPIDRTIVRIPKTDDLVLVYNKYQEERALEDCRLHHLDPYWPLAVIPELNFRIFSRCIVCRMDGEGTFQSLQPEDYERFIRYLSR